MHRLILLGLNHTTASLEVREKLAFSPQQCATALAAFRRRFTGAEAVILSTCNRVEFYTARAKPDQFRLDDLTSFVAGLRDFQQPALSPHLYHKADQSVVEHLFRVASSLDSMVLGETQILGQVRQAYDTACAAGAAGAMLNPLFQRAVAVGRQVMAQTPLGEGRVSVAGVAVDYARQIFDTFTDKTVLIIGAGKMAGLLVSHLAALSPRTLLLCNRDLSKAQALAKAHGGTAVPMDQLPDHLTRADIVASSTGATEPIILRKDFEQVMRRRRHKPVFLIDLAVPRDIDPGVGRIDNVYLYNMDDLQQVVAATRSGRQGAIHAADEIVAAQVREYTASQQVREVGPLIHRLYNRYHEIARQELSRSLAKMPDLSPEERSHLEDLARRLVNKLLHDPVQRLRESEALRESAAHSVETIESLFNLPSETAITPDAAIQPMEGANPQPPPKAVD